MIELTFSESQVAELQMLKNHTHPIISRRSWMLLLKKEGIEHHKIARVVGVCENTARQCFKAFKEGGLEQVKELRYRKPESQLKPFEVQVREYFDKTPPATIAQACTEIKSKTGVALKPTQMRAYIKSLGIKRRKVGSLPAKADIEAQKKFHDKQLQPRLEEALSGKRTVYFMDSAHFVLGAFLAYLWSFTRLFVKTPSGRQRFNVLGALDAVTKKLVTVTNDTYITSIQVCELLRKLALDATIPITIVLDNARYQRCNLVMQLAQELNIELLFLPPYSPNLNLIERLWKLVKKQCLNCVYHCDFFTFRQSIETFLGTMNQTHAKELDSLLTLNFQTFNEEQFKRAA